MMFGATFNPIPFTELHAVMSVPGTQSIPSGAETQITFNTAVYDQFKAYATPGLFVPTLPGIYRGDVWIQLAGVAGAGTHFIRLAATVTLGGVIIAKTMGLYNIDAFDKFIALPIRAQRFGTGFQPQMMCTLEQSTGGARTISAGVWAMEFLGANP